MTITILILIKMRSGNLQHSPTYRRLIGCKRWRDLRALKLTEQPYCERCLQEGRRRPASVVHHIQEVESGRTVQECEALCYNIHNLMSLCPECHAAIHRELRSHSKEQHQAREAERLRQWVSRLRGDG